MVDRDRRLQETRQPKGCLVYKSLLKQGKKGAGHSIRGQFITHMPLSPVSCPAYHSLQFNIMCQFYITQSSALLHINHIMYKLGTQITPAFNRPIYIHSTLAIDTFHCNGLHLVLCLQLIIKNSKNTHVALQPLTRWSGTAVSHGHPPVRQVLSAAHTCPCLPHKTTGDRYSFKNQPACSPVINLQNQHSSTTMACVYQERTHP